MLSGQKGALSRGFLHSFRRHRIWHYSCTIIPVMKNIILCSSNPLLIKNVYCVLRDEGYTVDTVEHPALAVKKVLWGAYDFVIVDSEPFGMSAGEAAQIIKSVAPGMPIMFMGGEGELDHAAGTGAPLDLEAFTKMIHSMAV
jgi:DNA-binding NtrC family response regulator